MPARDYYLKSKRHGQLPEGHLGDLGATLCQREHSAPHTHTVAPVWRAERGSEPLGGVAARGPPVGVLRSAAHRRAESRFWGVFIIAVHRASVLGWGARHRGIVELSKGKF